eukprot:gene18422-21959_t
MELSPRKRLNFDNTEIAFRNKSNSDLNSAYWLFKAIGSNFLTKVGPPVTNFFLRAGLPIKSIIKATIFKQFCGGETIAECKHTIEQLSLGRVGTILDYSVEGEEEEEVFDFTCEEIIRTIERAEGDPRIPITVFKITGIGRFALLEKLDVRQALNDTETAEFERVRQRCEKICRRAYEKNVPIMIDAEETWIQKTIDELALDMMRLFNREKLLVYNTYQMYRHDKLADMKADHLIAKESGFVLGVKMVRGAYMEKERKRAEEMGYPSPIQPDKQQIKHNHPHVYFAQLLGMSDNLSFNLSDADYNVAKYVPYGPVKAVLPYLFRRAQENTSVAGQTGRELSLIEKEKKRRKL